jgi:hypothetical protein
LFARQEEAVDCCGHVGQQEWIGEVSQPRLEEAADCVWFSQATIQQALCEEWRNV